MRGPNPIREQRNIVTVAIKNVRMEVVPGLKEDGNPYIYS